MFGRQILAWRSGMKAPCMSERTRQRHTWRSQWPRVCNALWSDFKHGQSFGSFPMWENPYSKAKGWIDFFCYVECLEVKIFQCGFLEEHKVCVKNYYWSSTYRNEVAIMVTKPQFLVATEEMLVAFYFVRQFIGDHIKQNFENWNGY